jgi:hypothetical protein
MWSFVLTFFACLLLTSDGSNLNSDVDSESSDIVSDSSSNLTKFDKNHVKLSSNQFIGNNGIANILKRSEEGNKELPQKDSEEVYYYYEDDNGDVDNEGEEIDEEGENFKVSEYRTEDKLEDSNNEDNVSESMQDRLDNKDIRTEENIGSKDEAELLRVTRGHEFDSSEDRTKPAAKFDDTNYNDAKDGNNRISYNYDDVKNHNDDNDDYSDGYNDSEEHRPTLQEDNGARAVADYVVDSIRSASSDEGGAKRRCLFGWRLDANGVCTPLRSQCEPGFFRNEEGNCVAPETGYWYK